MAFHEQVSSLSPDQLDSVSGGAATLGVYRPGFPYKKESLRFFRACVGDDVYTRAMNSEIIDEPTLRATLGWRCNP